MKINFQYSDKSQEESQEIAFQFMSLLAAGKISLACVPHINGDGDLQTTVRYKAYGEKPWKHDTEELNGTGKTFENDFFWIRRNPNFHKPFVEEVDLYTNMVLTCACGEKFFLYDDYRTFEEGLTTDHPVFAHLLGCAACKESTPFKKAVEKVQAFSYTELVETWKALRGYNPFEDWAEGVSMDEWAQLVYSEMDRRGIPHFGM